MRIALVAGEASGDLLASLLLEGLHRQWPQPLQTFGIGGSAMRARGFEAWWDCSELAVRGYVEVLRHYRRIVRIRAQLRERLLRTPPDLFIGVDAPDFNLDLARALKARGVPTVQFVSPSIWAWRAERIEQVRASVDHVLCLFPFEPALYARVGICASYVGHPLAQVIPMVPDTQAARHALHLPPQAKVVAVLPGSRASEIRYLGPTFARVARSLLQADPALHCVVPAVPNLLRTVEAQYQEAFATAAPARVHIVEGQSHHAIAACDAALVASGTATLEVALFKRPMVIAYKMHWLSWLWMRKKKLQPWVGLPNILCEEFVVPEFLQEEASAAALTRAVEKQLHDVQNRAQLTSRFTRLHERLRQDTSTLAAAVLARLCPCGGSDMCYAPLREGSAT